MGAENSARDSDAQDRGQLHTHRIKSTRAILEVHTYINSTIVDSSTESKILRRVILFHEAKLLFHLQFPEGKSTLSIKLITTCSFAVGDDAKSILDVRIGAMCRAHCRPIQRS